MFRPLKLHWIAVNLSFRCEIAWLQHKTHQKNATKKREMFILRIYMWITLIERVEEAKKAEQKKLVWWNLGCNQAVILVGVTLTRKFEPLAKSPYATQPMICMKWALKTKATHIKLTDFVEKGWSVAIDLAFLAKWCWCFLFASSLQRFSRQIQRSEDKVNYWNDMRTGDPASQTYQIETNLCLKVQMWREEKKWNKTVLWVHD